MNHIAIAAAASALMIGAGAGSLSNAGAPAAQNEMTNPMVGGQAMLPGQTIAENAAHSPDHTTLVAALRKTGLVETLAGKGSYTIFAPTNAAFAAVPGGAEALLKDKGRLAKVLGYQIVRGRYDSQTLLKMISQNGGTAKLKTLEGGTIAAMLNGPTNIVLVDEKGNVADIAIYDVYQANGVMQVTDKVALPG